MLYWSSLANIYVNHRGNSINNITSMTSTKLNVDRFPVKEMYQTSKKYLN